MSQHPESRFTHPICDDCWWQIWFTPAVPADPGSPFVSSIGGSLREPIRTVGQVREWEQCCRCGNMTYSGIYERADPNDDDHQWWCMESDQLLAKQKQEG